MNGSFVIKRGATVLADGLHTSSFVSDGPKINGQRLLDVAAMLFADRPRIFDRELDTDQCSFTISRQHADLAAAMDHAIRSGRTVRGVADLRIELTDGAVSTAWISRNAGWEATEMPAPTGVASLISYRVICPGWEVLSTVAATDFFYLRRLYGGSAGEDKPVLYHGGGAGDVHLNTLRQYHGGSAADRT